MERDEMTICVNCRFCEDVDNETREYECIHPAVRLHHAVDPVTGELGFYDPNDRERSYYGISPQPLCRDVNKKGNCPHYAKKA